MNASNLVAEVGERGIAFSTCEEVLPGAWPALTVTPGLRTQLGDNVDMIYTTEDFDSQKEEWLKKPGAYIIPGNRTSWGGDNGS